MAADKCPKHGMQIYSRFCEHAMLAVESLGPMDVYLRRDQWGWCTLCPACALLPAEAVDTDFYVCEKCTSEWALATGSDYLQRCQRPVDEFP